MVKFAFLSLLQLFSFLSIVFDCTNGAAKIDSQLSPKFLTEGKTENVMVSFTQGSTDPVINDINQQNFSSIDEKRTALTNAQQTFSTNSQAPLAALLSTQGVTFETFWIDNKMYVPNANSELIQTIAGGPGVASVEKEQVYNLGDNLDGNLDDDGVNGDVETNAGSNLAWGIQKIRADRVWSSYKGTGIVVANIDTGVRYTHVTLRSRWRSSYGWFDAYQGSTTPKDEDGHGTHTMGTITGSNGIGVAPGATWIACRGCRKDSCGDSQLHKCAQWIQCPTKPDGSAKDCSKAPRVVSNSWGGDQGKTDYNTIISSWKSSGIIPVFSIGNSGSACGSANSPGDSPLVIGVGNVDSNERIAGLSSRGPSAYKKVKPDIVAPGVKIRSANNFSDTGYRIMSGTSMACPHVSGTIALMLQKNPKLNYNSVYNAITKSTFRSLSNSNTKACGDIALNKYPNNVFGYGRIDAWNAVNAV